MLPSPQQFHDLINTMESAIIAQGIDIISVMKWANLWNDVGLVGLNTNDMGRLQEFRNFVHSQKKGGMVYSLVPKDLVSNKTTITTLLRYNYRDYDLAALPGGLFKRNLGLNGSLVVTKSRLFGANDKTIKGESKEGWRYIEMEADMQFMAVLENYPESHRFTLGSDTIQIWGGKRKADPNQTNNNKANKSRGGKNGGVGSKGRAGQAATSNNNNIRVPISRTQVVDLTGGGQSKSGTANAGAGRREAQKSQDPGGARGGAKAE